MKSKWFLAVYDLVPCLFAAFIFLWYYGGGGILTTNQKIAHTLLFIVLTYGMRFGWKIYKQIWRYGGIQCYMRLLVCDSIVGGCYIILNLLLPIQTIATSRVISICSINTLFALSMRMIYRYAFKCGNNNTALGRFLNSLLRIFAGEDIQKQRKEQAEVTHVAIIGAGTVGVSLAEELLNSMHSNEVRGAGKKHRVGPDGRCVPVCFIDTSARKAGGEIRGIPVLNEKNITQEILRDMHVDMLVITLPKLDNDRRKECYEFYQQFHLPIKVYDYPVMRKAGEKMQLRNLDIEELLFRTPVDVMNDRTRAYYSGKRILITGGGGSIGSELVRQLAPMNPSELILLDIYENGVYDVQQELKRLYGDRLKVNVEIASIANVRSMERVFKTYHPDIVINAAAHKHVPLMEHNCIEAVENNIFGTKTVLDMCVKYHTKRFMMLSTDKAVNPTNVMGTTKRVCEMLMETYSQNSDVICSATRFGNVLGSAGSVIPLFQRQIAAGGPVTLTDKRIIRYFMTIPEASQLVLTSGAMAENGELFVLDMGQPVKILDLAENMIRLSGLQPYADIDIVETGLRPGEKLYEELLVRDEELDKTENSLIFIERDKALPLTEMQELLEKLKNACESEEDEQVRDTLHCLVPTYRTPEEVNRRAVADAKTKKAV